MDITITTPALLFPAISVLFLAYSNRFLAIATRIREQHNLFNKTQSPVAKKQIDSLRLRIHFIVAMQLFAVIGIICCTVAMGLIFYGLQYFGNLTFGMSMIFIVLSLLASISELLISTKALNIELEDMEVKLEIKEQKCCSAANADR
jgi:F0F1-type ATP synthase assembly protein I